MHEPTPSAGSRLCRDLRQRVKVKYSAVLDEVAVVRRRRKAGGSSSSSEEEGVSLSW